MAATIAGTKNPIIGNLYTYTVFSPFPVTNEKWMLYFGEKQLFQKTVGEVTFGNIAFGRTYRLVCTYEDALTKTKVRAEISLVPLLGEPKIVKVHWEDSKRNVLDSKKAQVSYLEPVFLIIDTANIPKGEKLELTFYEDEYLSGHDSSSVKMDEIFYAFIRESGRAEIELSTKILEKFMEKANANDLFFTDAEHDYYVQIKYNDKLNVIEDKAQLKVKNKVEFFPKLRSAKVVTLDEEDAILPVKFDEGTWNVIVTENYTGKKCDHIDSPRANCRRAIIKVYDHNKKVVYTFSDGLMEGTGGTDRMKENADTPLGKYKINTGTPFTYGSNRGSTGPNKQLVFEPIRGQGDEADLSKRSGIRMHGGRQEIIKPPKKRVLRRTHGCIRVYDSEIKAMYDWWVGYHASYPNILPGHVFVTGSPNTDNKNN